MSRRVISVSVLAGVAGFLFGFAQPARAQSGGNAKIYIGTYAKSIFVVDESNLRVTDTIPVSIGIPIGLTPSQDQKHLYVNDATFESVEVIDVATRQPIDRFTLSDGNKRVRIWGMNVDPQERFAVLLVKTSTKEVDRFKIDEPTLLKYDLKTHTVTDTIPWPRGEVREFAQVLFSPDGKYLYFFTDNDILIYDAITLKQVDRWQLSAALPEGMGRFNFGFGDSPYEEEGYYTSLFRVTDPVQNRTLMGVARVNLVAKSVDFYTLGPSEPVGFALAPGRTKAYGIRRQTGTWEFWTFDLANRRVGQRVPFAGRPRMGLTVSSNGRLLYIHTAGPTIDVFDANTLRHIRQVDLGADMTEFLLLPERRPGRTGN